MAEPRLHPRASTVSFLNGTTPPEYSTLSLHDALPIYARCFRIRESAALVTKQFRLRQRVRQRRAIELDERSEEHTSELQSLAYLVCRLLLEKKHGSNPQQLEAAQVYQVAGKRHDDFRG